MQGSFEQPPIIIRTSMSRSLVLMFGCGLATAFCGLALSVGPSVSSRALGGVLAFGLGVPYFAWKTISPDVLTLSRDGIEWRSRWKTTHWSWREASHFRAVRIHIASKAVAFDLTDGTSAPKSYTNYYVSYSGADASIGGGWEIDAPALADLLNDAHARWGAAG
jgi:hypothetical protein